MINSKEEILLNALEAIKVKSFFPNGTTGEVHHIAYKAIEEYNAASQFPSHRDCGRR